MRLLVTGASGFVGGHFLRRLPAAGLESLLALSRSGRRPAGCEHFADILRCVALDLLDRAALRQLLHQERPDHILHLAGFASPALASKNPLAAWEGNLTCTLHLYQTLAELDLRPRVLAVGTGLVYGDHPDRTTLTEDTPLRPGNPYTASKAAADLAGLQYALQPGLAIVRVRPFTHTGPGQSADYAIANFARQLVAIERGRQPPILETGNLTSRRDLTDVRDIVAAYRLLLKQGQPGEVYNIASGSTFTMREVLDQLIALVGIPVEVRPRADLVRTADLSVPRVDFARLCAATGWNPTIPLKQTLHDILESWRQSNASEV